MEKKEETLAMQESKKKREQAKERIKNLQNSDGRNMLRAESKEYDSACQI